MLTGILGDSEIDNYYWIVVEFAGTSASVLFYVRTVATIITHSLCNQFPFLFMYSGYQWCSGLVSRRTSAVDTMNTDNEYSNNSYWSYECIPQAVVIGQACAASEWQLNSVLCIQLLIYYFATVKDNIFFFAVSHICRQECGPYTHVLVELGLLANYPVLLRNTYTPTGLLYPVLVVLEQQQHRACDYTGLFVIYAARFLWSPHATQVESRRHANSLWCCEEGEVIRLIMNEYLSPARPSYWM